MRRASLDLTGLGGEIRQQLTASGASMFSLARLD